MLAKLYTSKRYFHLFIYSFFAAITGVLIRLGKRPDLWSSEGELQIISGRLPSELGLIYLHTLLGAKSAVTSEKDSSVFKV